MPLDDTFPPAMTLASGGSGEEREDVTAEAFDGGVMEFRLEVRSG